MDRDKINRYIKNYMEENYSSLSKDNQFVGRFLFKEVKGKVLDCGCGPSLIYWALFMHKANLIDAFDILPQNIAYLKKVLTKRKILPVYYRIENYVLRQLLKTNHKKGKLIDACFEKINMLKIADMRKPLHFKPNHYDTVTEIGCIGCVKTHAELLRSMKNMHKHLKSGGKAIMINWKSGKPYEPEEVETFEGEVKISRSIFEKSLKEVGFKNVKIHSNKSLLKNETEYKELIYGTAIKK